MREDALLEGPESGWCPSRVTDSLGAGPSGSFWTLELCAGVLLEGPERGVQSKLEAGLRPIDQPR